MEYGVSPVAVAKLKSTAYPVPVMLTLYRTPKPLAPPVEALQQAFWEEHGLQCGFCTPGMLMVAIELLSKNPNPTEDEIREAISGNLCRCTGYQNIVKSIASAAKKMRAVTEAAA